MKILVTAFRPFNGRSENASSAALAQLKRSHPEINTRVLPVDSVTGPARLLNALKQLRPDTLIMLGEAAGSTAVRLETTAWNQLDFSIPDAGGRQPRSSPVDLTGQESLPATLPLAHWHHELTLAGHKVMLSDDPGRYLCNQVMYRSLGWLAKHHPACGAGFIHLPLAKDCPTQQSVEVLRFLLDDLQKSRLRVRPTFKPSR